jgi:hypothetical protein
MCDSGRCELARAQNDYVTLSISDDDQEISVIVLLAALPGRLSMLTIGVPIFEISKHIVVFQLPHLASALQTGQSEIVSSNSRG